MSLILGLPSIVLCVVVVFSASWASLLQWGLLLSMLSVSCVSLFGSLLIRRQLESVATVATVANDILKRRQATEDEMRQFVADASHELRTPLTTILGYCQLTRMMPAGSPDAATAVGKIEEDATRMKRIVEDLLLLARIDAERDDGREKVDVTQIVRECFERARMLDVDRSWRLDVPDEPVVAVAARDRLRKAVTNLLANAQMHTPPGTAVTLRTSIGGAPGDRRAIIAVHDTGPGLPQGFADEAFRRFTRSDSSRARTSGGTGLGLAITRAVARSQGGDITVRSRPGDTTFELWLPAGTNNPPRRPAPAR